MPKYDYKCTNTLCKYYEVPIVASISYELVDSHVFKCPQCGEPMRRAVSSTPVQYRIETTRRTN